MNRMLFNPLKAPRENENCLSNEIIKIRGSHLPVQRFCVFYLVSFSLSRYIDESSFKNVSDVILAAVYSCHWHENHKNLRTSVCCVQFVNVQHRDSYVTFSLFPCMFDVCTCVQTRSYPLLAQHQSPFFSLSTFSMCNCQRLSLGKSC